MPAGGHPNHGGKIPIEIQAIYSRAFLGLCGVIISLCGVVVGLWSSAIERDLADIRKTLDARADLPPRTTELERRTGEQDKELDDHEGRIRTLERARR